MSGVYIGSKRKQCWYVGTAAVVKKSVKKFIDGLEERLNSNMSCHLRAMSGRKIKVFMFSEDKNFISKSSIQTKT